MNLEAIVQSEASQKEKDKHCILMYVYRISKIVLINLFAGQQWWHRYREHMWEHSVAGHGEWIERVA